MRLLISTLALALGFAMSSGAYADTSDKLGNFIRDPRLRQSIINAAAQSTVIVNNPCEGATYSVALSPIVANEVLFNDNGVPTSGLLKFPVKEEGCGLTRILNVYVTVKGVGEVATFPILPGTTLASLQLQKDAVFYAVQASAAVVGKNDDCKTKYVENTEFIERDKAVPNSATGPSWRERWTLVQCTKRIFVPMQFIPDAKGTTIASGGPEVRAVDLTDPSK